MDTVEKNGPHLKIDMLSQPRYLAAARAMVSAVAHRFGFEDAACGQIALALDEALCNVIKHGYDQRDDGPITISVQPISDPPRGIRIEVLDRGNQVDPETIQPRDLNEIRPGGLGVHIIREVMSVAEYSPRPGGGMCLILEKTIGGDDNAAPERTGSDE